MRFIVYGAGAIGCVVGGRLFQAGNEVVLIGRGEHGRRLREVGLRLESADGAEQLKIPAVETLAEAGPTKGDVLLLATKSQQTMAALQEVYETEVTLVTLQNGVENERVALRRFKDVVAACVVCPASFLEPGVVQANSSPLTGLLDVGRYPSGVDERVREVARAFSGATFESIAREDIVRWKYAKLLMNLGNAVEALCGPSTRNGDLVRAARREGEACLKAAGIDFASEEEDHERRGELLHVTQRGGSSSWQSLQRGTGSIETDFLNGEIVLLGRLHGVPTPLNLNLQRLAHEAARLGTNPGAYSVEDLTG
jgi:2-dehydropantoate 2-reductase